MNQVNAEANKVIKWAHIRTANEHQLELAHAHHSTCARLVKTSLPHKLTTRVSKANKPGRTKKG